MKFETYDDAVYAHTDWIKYTRGDHPDKDYKRMVSGWVQDRARHGNAAAMSSAMAFAMAEKDAVSADILWMSTEMMDLVQVAMEGFDYSVPITLEDIFVENGFLVLPHAFLSEDMNYKKIGWRMLSWNVQRDYGSIVPSREIPPELMPRDVKPSYEENEVFLTSRPYGDYETYHQIRFIQVSYVEDEDDFQDWTLARKLIDKNINWGVAHAVAMPMQYVHAKNEVGPPIADWLLFWRVANRLMQERIVISETRQPGRAARRDALRFSIPPSVLRVVELRRPTERHEPEGEGRDAPRWTHRWIVRGGWQWRRCGPGWKDRRQVYIGEYEKGPKDLELIVKRRVWNWDR